jgi:DNA-binding transcriptional LysR family regulator
VELVVDNRAVNLSRREADIALRMRAVVSRRHASPPQESLIGRRLGTLAMALYASRDYLQRHGEPADAAALGGHHLIGFDDSLADAGYAGWLGGLAVGARTPFSANSLQAHLMAIRAGFGIGITSRVLAREHPELVPVLPDLTPPMPEVWLLYHADLKGAARVRAALDFLIEEIQADPDMLLRE